MRTRTLADVIAFNKANARSEMALFGQEMFEQAREDQGPRRSRPTRRRGATSFARGRRRTASTGCCKRHKLDALVGPTMPPAWKIDAVHGDQISGGGAGSLAAVAGYPHLTVPMGQVKGLPVGLSFIGPKWSDALHAVARLSPMSRRAGRFPAPSFCRSIEESPEVAPLLRAGSGA